MTFSIFCLSHPRRRRFTILVTSGRSRGFFILHSQSDKKILMIVNFFCIFNIEERLSLDSAPFGESTAKRSSAILCP